MIRDLENGVRLVELGLGTTQISQVLVDGNTMSSGICFGNKVPINGQLQGDEVIVSVANFQGAVSYIKAVVELLKTWEIEGLEKQIEELNESLNKILKY